MKQRVLTGLIFAFIFIPGIFAGGIYFYCLGLIITFVGTFELLNMFSKKNDGLKVMKYIIPLFSSLLFTMLTLACTKSEYGFVFDEEKLGFDCVNFLRSFYIKGYAEFNGFFFAFLIGLLSIFIICFSSIFMRNPGRSAIDMLISFLYGGVMMSMALCVEYLPAIKTAYNGFFNKVNGRMFAYVYSIVCLTDVFAYFVGVKFGKHKLCPTISPKKSVEGAIGGTIVGALAGTGIALLFRVVPFDNTMGTGTIVLIVSITFVLSVLISICSQFGDLFASVLKRENEIKDYGNILPGHGGIMDRFDSLVFSAGFFFLIYFIVAYLI